MICTGWPSRLSSGSTVHISPHGRTIRFTPSIAYNTISPCLAAMLSPNDFAPRGKAPSIWSVDSGYASNTLEDDEPHQVRIDIYVSVGFYPAAYVPQAYPRPNSSVSLTHATNAQQTIGLGICGIWNVHVEDQLRLRRPEAPAVPVTTKLNVFTTTVTANDYVPLSGLVNRAGTCITCQLWDITKPGQGLKCDDCKSKSYINPSALHRSQPKPDVRLVVPHPESASKSQSERFGKRRNETRCSACVLAHAVDPASSGCHSCTSDSDRLSVHSPLEPSTVRRSCAKRPSKLPSDAVQHLRAWLKANQDDPYPNPDTKRILAQECGITEKQVTTWFTNTRARKLALPNDRSHPSSEDEGIYESDFSSIANTPICTNEPSFGYGTPSICPTLPSFSGPSTFDVSQLRLQTSRRGKKKDYRRMATASPIDDSPIPRTPATPSPNRDGGEQETWECTFCSQPLVPKSWRRHEETQHRPKYQWTCLATGPRLVVASRAGTSSICAFCQAKNPSEDHFLESHRIVECSKKDPADRTFGRPDHLRQHIKNFHKTSLIDLVREKWRKDGPGKNVNEGWTCGFCAVELKTWDIRETHIANHFKNGLTMALWTNYTRPTSLTPEINIRRQSREEHSGMFAKLKRTLTGRSNHQPDPKRQAQGHFANTFAPLPISTGGPSFAAPSVLSQLPNPAFGACVPEGFTGDFNLYDTFNGSFDPNFDHAGNSYDAILDDEALQMDFDALTNPELYGNFVDYHGNWGQQQQ